MSKKRFIKLLMGQCGYSRNDANILAKIDLSIWGNYKSAWFINHSSLAKFFKDVFTQRLDQFGLKLITY